MIQCPRNRVIFVPLRKLRRKFRDKDNTAIKRQKRKDSLEQRMFHQTLLECAVKSEMEMIDNNKRSRSARRSTKKKTAIPRFQNVEIKNTRKPNYEAHRRKDSRKKNGLTHSRNNRSQSKPLQYSKSYVLSKNIFKKIYTEKKYIKYIKIIYILI